MSFRELKKVDYVIIVFVVLLLAVAGLVFFGKNKLFYKTPVQAEKKVAFQVFFRGITITNPDSPFRVGDDSFITIRNVPYTKLKIVDVKFDRRKIALPSDNKEKFVVIDDVSSPFQYDFLITLVDTGKITDDGVVVGGNKLKIGVPIVLEGKNYKLNGTLSDVVVLDEKEIQKAVEAQKKLEAEKKSVPTDKK